MKKLLKTVLSNVGLELRRRPDADLPFIQHIRHGDIEFDFWITNRHTKAWWGRADLRMNAEYAFIHASCAPGAVVADVGAHHGMQTIPCALYAGNAGRVYAFEANAENALTLHANVALNGLTNCTCVYAAIGAAAGEVHMQGEAVAGGSPSGRVVRVIALDSYFAAQGGEQVDLIKIDVEGYEAEVLKGTQQTLAKHPHISMELHLDDLHAHGTTAAEVFSLIPTDAYEISMMQRDVSWDETVAVSGVADLPARGVVNLFFRRRYSPRP